jgi:L-lactate dehydrogenase complex protein LldG
MVSVRVEEEFIAQATAAGGEIVRFSNLGNALAFALDFFKQQGLKAVVLAPDLPLPSAGTETWPLLRPRRREDYLAAGAGLVRADYGVSGTGTLVHLDRSADEKIVWTLPPLCLCLLESRRIVQDLDDISAIVSRHLAEAASGEPQVSLVTGPSRTTDIECRLTLGVHGPSRLIILLHDGQGS